MHASPTPPSPQFDCDVFTATLDTLLDGESDAVTTARAEAHARTCRPCGQRLAAAGRYKQAMRRLGERLGASDALRDAVLGTLRGVRGSPTR